MTEHKFAVTFYRSPGERADRLPVVMEHFALAAREFVLPPWGEAGNLRRPHVHPARRGCSSPRMALLGGEMMAGLRANGSPNLQAGISRQMPTGA